MSVAKFSETTPEIVRLGLERRNIYTPNLMTVIVDFSDGPWTEAEPFHSHPHEQTSYIAEGEVIFYCEGEPDHHLCPGDMFAVPSGKLHTVKLLTPTARLVDSFNPIRQEFIK
ncbi:MAG: cupin domain-containing protein [Prolixibacteraceae bacterium]|nr:cupin domain-containing protein [Prolixibacteraceae bacterium]